MDGKIYYLRICRAYSGYPIPKWSGFHGNVILVIVNQVECSPKGIV
jgi:hypothetical protein